MTVSVRDAKASERDRRWIQSVYRDYLDDLAPDTGTFPTLGEVGHREPDQLARWFGDPNVFPLTILKATEPVGFAMVVRAPPALRATNEGQGGGAFEVQVKSRPAAGQQPVDYRMAEFFVARTRRRLGIGAAAVQLILSRFSGRWEITEYLQNDRAVSFWRRVVATYTRGTYQERISNGEVRQVFDSSVRR